MTSLKWIFLLIFFSCIDLITRSDKYNSIYFTGGSWIEMGKIETMRITETTNDFTIQFWVSGNEVDTNEAPALFSMVDTQDNIRLALFRDKGENNIITTMINSSVIDDRKKISQLDWIQPDSFYLISILLSDTGTVKGYVNDSKFIEIETPLNISDTKFIVGAVVNEKLTIRENFWYGYIDEVRLWNTILSDSTISFQSKHPAKLGEYYRHTKDGIPIQTYLDSLIGLWRFNLQEPTYTIKDESENGNNGIIYTLTGYSLELSDKGKK